MAVTKFTPKAVATLDRQISATHHAMEKLRRETRAKYKRMEARLLKDVDQINKLLGELRPENAGGSDALVPRQQ